MKRKKEIILSSILISLLGLVLVSALQISVQDNCTIINSLSFNNSSSSIDGNISLLCFNRTIDLNVSLVNTTVFNNTYPNATIVNVFSNGTYVTNITQNITNNITTYVNTITGFNQSTMYTKEEVESMLSSYAKINDIPILPANFTNITDDVQKLKDQNSSLYIWNIVTVFAIILAILAIAMGIKQIIE